MPQACGQDAELELLRVWTSSWLRTPLPSGVPPQDLWGVTEQAFRAFLGKGKYQLRESSGPGGSDLGVGLSGGHHLGLNPSLSPRPPGICPPGGPAVSVGQLGQRVSL